jgi:hypothetical protein
MKILVVPRLQYCDQAVAVCTAPSQLYMHKTTDDQLHLQQTRFKVPNSINNSFKENSNMPRHKGKETAASAYPPQISHQDCAEMKYVPGSIAAMRKHRLGQEIRRRLCKDMSQARLFRDASQDNKLSNKYTLRDTHERHVEDTYQQVIAMEDQREKRAGKCPQCYNWAKRLRQHGAQSRVAFDFSLLDLLQSAETCNYCSVVRAALRCIEDDIGGLEQSVRWIYAARSTARSQDTLQLEVYFHSNKPKLVLDVFAEDKTSKFVNYSVIMLTEKQALPDSMV